MGTLTAGGAQQGAALAFECVNPLEHADVIKQLFVAHDRPEFPDFFDRTYPAAVAVGGASWIGRDEHGGVCAHVARFPREFRYAGRTVRSALLGNLMVAAAHRRFWPALRLLRRVVDDVKAEGGVDFVYGDPNERAQPVVQAVGFRTIGAVRRFVLPVADRRRVVALALRAYAWLGRVRGARLLPTDLGTSEPDAPVQALPTDGESVVPIRKSPTYRSRLAGYPDPGDRWYAFQTPGVSGRPIATALARGPDARGLSLLCAVQYERLEQLSSVLVSLVPHLRANGALRVEISLMDGSGAARQARRAGFLPRSEQIPVLALPLTALGREVVATNGEWRLMPVDLDR